MLSDARKRGRLPAADAARAEAATWPGETGPRSFLEGLGTLGLGRPPSSFAKWLGTRPATRAGTAEEETPEPGNQKRCRRGLRGSRIPDHEGSWDGSAVRLSVRLSGVGLRPGWRLAAWPGAVGSWPASPPAALGEPAAGQGLRLAGTRCVWGGPSGKAPSLAAALPDLAGRFGPPGASQRLLPQEGANGAAGEGGARLLGKCRGAEGERRAISGEWRGAAPEEALIGKEARQIRG